MFPEKKSSTSTLIHARSHSRWRVHLARSPKSAWGTWRWAALHSKKKNTFSSSQISRFQCPHLFPPCARVNCFPAMDIRLFTAVSVGNRFLEVPQGSAAEGDTGLRAGGLPAAAAVHARPGGRAPDPWHLDPRCCRSGETAKNGVFEGCEGHALLLKAKVCGGESVFKALLRRFDFCLRVFKVSVFLR